MSGLAASAGIIAQILHTPTRVEESPFGSTKQFVLNANAFVLWSSRKDEGNITAGPDGIPDDSAHYPNQGRTILLNP